MPISPESRSSAKRREMRDGSAGVAIIFEGNRLTLQEKDGRLKAAATRLRGEKFAVGGHVFVAAAGEVEDDQIVQRKARACRFGKEGLRVKRPATAFGRAAFD